MIEIMARALCEARSSRRTETSRRRGGRPAPMSLAIARLDAKAVQQAIRNPTDAMTRAGASVPIPMSTPNEDASVLVWQANVDAMETAGDG